MSKLSVSDILKQAYKADDKTKEVRKPQNDAINSKTFSDTCHRNDYHCCYVLLFQLKLVEYGKGLFHYFDYVLFHGEQPLQLNEVRS